MFIEKIGGFFFQEHWYLKNLKKYNSMKNIMVFNFNIIWTKRLQSKLYIMTITWSKLKSENKCIQLTQYSWVCKCVTNYWCKRKLYKLLSYKKIERF